VSFITCTLPQAYDQVKDDEIGRACSTYEGRRGIHIGFWWESQKKRDHSEDLDVGGRIILRWILEKQGEVIWNGLIWLRIVTSGWLL
jgi:hypothetical protein